MELGSGDWELEALRAKFLEHLKCYERVFTLRSLQPKSLVKKYELVEIPMSLLEEARTGDLVWSEKSKAIDKPGFCYVPHAVTRKKADRLNLKFQLYFDGAGEKKLQIQQIRKDLCVVHATWGFEVQSFLNEEHTSP